jgi:hypothetical protein
MGSMQVPVRAATRTLVSIPGRTFPVNTFYLEDAMEMTNFDFPQDSLCLIANAKKKSSGRENEMDPKVRKAKKDAEIAVLGRKNAIEVSCCVCCMCVCCVLYVCVYVCMCVCV